MRTNPDALVHPGRWASTIARRCSRAIPTIFFTTPHYEGSPHVLVRLEAVDREELAGLGRGRLAPHAPAELVAGHDAH